MDGDTTRGKLDHDKILSAFSRGEGDILVGTQMIVKGHDFPRVTVVAAVLADLSLHEGDYLSGERTFDLLVQAAGRAGRGALPGRMLIQTYRPDHATIQAAAKQDYEAFYREEMVYRRLMKYPPASHLLRIELRGRDEAKLVTASDYLGQQARSFAGKHAIEVLGPTNASIYKKKDIYRKVIYCKNVNYDILIKLKDFLAEYVRINSGFSDLTLLFDFDPLSAS